MKKTVGIVALVILVAAGVAWAQDGADAADAAAMQEAWLKAGTPGPFQAFLAKKAGNWKIEGKTWMAPGAEPETSENTGTAEMILGGRYLQETMHGETMGMPFDGMGLTGYDNTTGLVTSIWIDSMSTATAVMTGKWDKPGAPLETSGTMTDPASGQEMQLRTVTTFISDDESLFEYFGTVGGMPEMKMMELHYIRVP